MNRQEIKTLKRIIKSIETEYLEDVADYPQMIQTFYIEAGTTPPSIDVIRLYLNKEISKRLKRIIIKETLTTIFKRK